MSKEWAVDSDTGLTVKPSGPFSVGISGYLFHSLHLGANQHALLCLMAPLLPDIASPSHDSGLTLPDLQFEGLPASSCLGLAVSQTPNPQVD